MNYAIDFRARKLLSATAADHTYGFFCPHCGSVVYRQVRSGKLPTFRHYPGEQQESCENFVMNPQAHNADWLSDRLGTFERQLENETLLDSLQQDEKAPDRRSAARWRLVQALYQWQMTGGNAEPLLRQFMQEISLLELDAKDNEGLDINHFEKILYGVVKRAQELDRGLEPVLDRPLEQLDPVEHAILRMGLYELRHCPNVPWRVVVNESVDLGKYFGAEQSHKYINSILDKLAQDTTRPAPKSKGK